MKYYIAYGSNISTEQMAYRCPTASVVGTAVIEDYELVFRRFATIEPQEGSSVPVAVWKIDEEDEHALDRYEGYPRSYIKKDIKVMLDSEREITAMVYIMTEGRPICAPSASYMKIIAEGYEEFDFDLDELYAAAKKSFAKTGKPKVHFSSYGETGNIYFILALVQRTLHSYGMDAEFSPMLEKVEKSGSYENALSAIRKVVDLIDDDGAY